MAENKTTGTATSTNKTSTDERASVFDTGYISTSKCSWYGDANFKGKAYLQWNTSTSSSSAAATSVLESLGDDAIWQILITDTTEQHNDLFGQYQTLAGNVCYFVTGAGGVQLNITAKVPISGTADYRTAFLVKYIKKLRAKQLVASNRMLTLAVKDTVCKLYILNLSLTETSAQADMVNLVITGLAYRYQNTHRTTSTITTMYGKTPAINTDATSDGPVVVSK